ncbi:MAG TPA: DNA polymerase III subunit delta [Firmicutes bacterium]|nr:DNA polymerase III subunit delta [Bacillota bacterium]
MTARAGSPGRGGDSEVVYRQYFRELQEGIVAPVYLLFGEEDYLMEEVVKKLAQVGLGEGSRDFNRDCFDGEEADLEEIRAAVEMLPFASPRRLVVVKNSPYFRGGKGSGKGKGRREELVALLEELPATTCLVFVTRGDVDQRLKAVQIIKKKGRLWGFPRLQGQDLTKWIIARIRRKGAKIAGATASYLAQLWVYDLNRLERELEKLVAYVGEGGEIGREHIQLLVDPGIRENIFYLLDAVGKRETRRALLLLNQMLAAGEPPLLLLFLLTQRLRLIGLARALAGEGLRPREIAARLKQHPFVIEKALEQGKQFSQEALENCLEECLWADGQLKGGRLEPKLVLELLLLKITEPKGHK